MRRPRAWVLNIGYELLIGRIVNSNGAYVARELTLRGAVVDKIVVVGDSIDAISSEIRRALQAADIVVTTGGLGPTDDDLTLEAVAAAVDRPLVLNRDALRMVDSFYSQKGLPLTPERLKMAYLPAGAEPLENRVGAAPGSILNLGYSVIISLPGVPREMEDMLPRALDKISYLFPKVAIVEKGMEIRGVPESTLAPLLRRAARACPDCYVKSHPRGHELRSPIIEVKVLASAATREEAEAKAESVLKRLRELLEGEGLE